MLATRLAQEAGVSPEETSHVYYTTLLRFVGCTAPMPEYAASLGVEAGKIVSSRGLFDRLGFVEQLGLAPQVAGTTGQPVS